MAGMTVPYQSLSWPSNSPYGLRVREGGSQRKIGVLIPGEVGGDPHSISGLFQVNGRVFFPATISHGGPILQRM